MAINFEIGLRLTDKELKSQLAGVRNDLTRAFTIKNADGGFAKEIAAAATQAKALEKALSAASTNKGISYAQLNLELAKAGTTAGKLTSTLAAGGTNFRTSLDQANNALALSNRHVLSLNRTLQEAARVFKQSFKFTVAQTAIRAISTEIRESVQWVTNLHDAVNNIAVVTGKTANQITAVTEQAIRGSKELRVAAEDYAKGALIFYQQGLNDEEVVRRNEITIKAAKAANQSIDDMSKQLTAIWNTYGMVGDEQLRAASVGAKMAAQTAVDFSDIAQAMQTAAAPAAQMGVEYNQLAAIIATVGDVTQQSASIIGNAYKTIFSRFQQLVSDGTDGEVTLGAVSSKLQDLGIQLYDSSGQLKNLGQTINEVGANWDNWSEQQQLAIAQLVGGTRQYGQFLALMQNFDKYQKNLSSAAGETGSTLEQQYTQALDSIESRAENAGEAWHRAFSNLISADSIKSAYKALEDFGNVADNVIKGLGGLPGIFSIVGVLLSSKIVPALQIAAKSAVALGASLIGKQQWTINKDFDASKTAIEKQGGMSDGEKEVALAKNKFSRDTAVINEQINSQLATATGLRRTELEMQQQQLETTQKNFSATMSQSQALEQKLQRQLEFYHAEDILREDSLADLERQEQEQEAYIALLNQELEILQAQAKQKTIIKNRPESQGGNVVEGHRYEGTANERRAQNTAYIKDTKNKLAAAQDSLTETRVRKDSAVDQGEEKQITRLIAAYAKLQKALADYQKQKMAGKTDAAARSMEEAKTAALQLSDGLATVKKNSQMTEEELEQYKKVLGSLDDNVDLSAVSDSLHNVGQEISNMATQGENSQQVLSQTQKNMVSNAQALGESTGTIARLQQEQADAAKIANQYQSATLSQGISLTVQFASAAAMAVNSIKNMWDIWNNPDLTGGEKALQIITSLSSMLMFTLPQFTSVIKKVQEFGRASIATAVAESAARTAGTTAEAAAEAGLAKAKEATGLAALKAGLMAQTAWGPLLPVILAITAAVAALAAAFIFFSSEAANTSPEGQLKKAEAAAENLAEAEQKAKQEADNLRSAIESYDSAIDTLNQCTKGTKEWDEALAAVHTQISNILKDFPELLKEQDLFNKDGTLNKDVLDKAQTKADNAATAASAASLMGQVNVTEKRAAVDTSKIANKYETYYDGYASNSGHTDGSFSTVNTDLQKVLKSYDNVGSKALELTDIYSILGNVTDDYAEEMLKLAQSHVDAAQMMENANKLLINEWADNNGEELAAGQAELMVQQQQEYYDNFAEAFKSASNQNMKAHNVDHSTLGSAFDGTSFEGMSVTEAFNAARGKNYQLAGNGVRGTDTNRSYVYLEDGEEKEYKMEEMQATVAAAAALEMMGQSAESAAGTLQTLRDNAGGEVATGIQNYLATGDLESMNGKDFAALQEGMGDKDAATYLQEVFDKTDEELKEMLGDDYAADFQQAVDNYATAFDDFKKGLYDVVQKGYESMDEDKDSLNVEGQKAMASAMQEAYVKAGTEGLDTVQQAFNALDEDNIQGFVDVVDGMDWSTQGPEDFIAALENAGIETELTAEQLTNFAKVMSHQDLGTEFTKLNEDFASLQKNIGSLETGDTIDAEVFDSLSDPMKQYFTMMEDGTYALVGDAEMLQNLLKGDNQKNRLDQISQLKQETKQTQSRLEGGQKLKDEYGEGITKSVYNAENNSYDSTMLKGQLDLLKQYQTELGLSDDKLNEWYEDLSDGSGHFEHGAAGLAEIAKYAAQAAAAMDADSDAITANGELMTQMQSAYLATAESVYELDMLYQQLGQEMGEFGVESSVYNEALINMASNYDNTTAEIEQMRQAMAAVEFDSDNNLTKASQEALDAAQDALKAATLIGEASEKYDLDARSVEVQAKALAKAYKEAHNGAEMSAQSAARLAVANQRMNKGISTLNSNFKGWKKTLQSCEKTSQDYADAVVGITDAVADLVGAEDGFELPDGFLDAPENLRLLEEAAGGSESAINQLGNLMAQAQVSAWEFNESLVNSAIAAGMLSEGFDASTFETYKGNVMAGLEELQGKIGELEEGQDVGDILGENWVESLNQMALATGMSVDEMNAMLNKMGVQAEVTTTSVPQQMEVPTYTEVTEPNPITRYTTDEDGNKKPVTRYGWKHYTVPGPPELVDGYVQVAQIKSEGNDSVGGTPKITWTGTSGRSSAGHSPSASTGGNKGGSGGGGGGSKSEHKAKNADKYEKLEDRYSTIKAAIDEVGRAIEDFSAAEDDAFGAAKYAAMKKQEKALQKQASLYKDLRKLAKDYLEIDKKEASHGENRRDLIAELKKQNLSVDIPEVEFNSEGFVANRTEIIQALNKELESLYDVYYQAAKAYDDAESTDEAEAERIEKLKENYEQLKKFVEAFIGDLDQVDETAQEAREALENELEKIREWMSNKVKMAEWKLEMKVDINNRDIEKMELLIRLWGDLGVVSGDTFKGLNENLNSTQKNLEATIETSERMYEILNNLDADAHNQDWFKNQYGEEAWNKYINGNGGLPEEVIEELKSNADDMMSYLTTMYDNAEEMLGQFIEAMNIILEDFDRIADKLTHNNEKLDMLEDLLDFSGKKYSTEGRDAMMSILKARVNTAQTAVANANARKKVADVALEEAQKTLEQFYEENGRDTSAYNDTQKFFYNNLKQTFDEATEAASSAQSEFYSSMQELTDAARAAIEESARIIAEELTDALGGVFDSMDSGLDMYNHQQNIDEFFLDDYDKGYELRKLLRSIDDAMEDVTDPERLAEWGTLIDDINAASADGVQITQTDLEILQARFDLQKAYDEYTDARAGKNTMRLQRDASGNYSYVYSSDSSAEDDGQQKIEDALANIHKMHREAAKEMESMWFQTYVEMQQYMSEVDQLRLQNDEKYAAEVQWYKDMYQQKLEHYRDQTIQHNQAIDRSYEETTLGVITGMNSMESTHEWYMEQALIYDSKLEASALEWEAQVRDTCNENGINYDNLEATVKEDTQKMIEENKALRQEIEKLKQEGIKNLQALGGQIRSFVSQGVNELERMRQKVFELIAALQELERQQLAKAEEEEEWASYGYDAQRDYSASIINRTAELKAQGYTDEDIMQDYYIQRWTAERWNKQTADEMEGHGMYNKDLTTDQAKDATEALIKNTQAINDNTQKIDESDESKKSSEVKNQNSEFEHGRDYSKNEYKGPTASGGLVKTPQVRSLAEDGPELVLNNEDTQKILQAVQLVRAQTQQAIALRDIHTLYKAAQQESAVREAQLQWEASRQETLDQQVHIEANFPGVSVASEIEDAFNQLVTQAAQYRIRSDR